MADDASNPVIRGWRGLIERFLPGRFERGGDLLVCLGVTSALVFVFTRTWYRGEFEDLPENLVVLTFLVSAWGQRRRLGGDLVFRLLLASIAIPCLLLAVNYWIDSAAALRYRSLNDLLKLFVFLPLAWWAGGSRRGAMALLTVAFLGLLTAVLLDPNLAGSLANFRAGKRVDFDIHNAQHGALLFAVVVLFCLSVIRPWDGAVPRRVRAAGVLACAFGVFGVVAVQTRAAFLGLALCAAFAALAWLRGIWRERRIPGLQWKGMLAFVLLAGLAAGIAGPAIEFVLTKDRPALRVLLSGNLDEVPFSSVGIRVHSWAESLDWIAARPLTGWGLKARSDVIALSDRFPDELKHYGHLHNGYLELLLAYGVTGLVFVGLLWWVLLRRIRAAADRPWYRFAFYGSLFFLVVNGFESFFFYWSGIFAFALLMAGGYSRYLATRLGDAHAATGRDAFEHERRRALDDPAPTGDDTRERATRLSALSTPGRVSRRKP